MRARRGLAVVVVSVVVLAACGGDEEDGSADATTTSTTTVTSTTAAPPTTTPVSSTTGTTTSTTTTPPSTTSTVVTTTADTVAPELPGEPLDLFVEAGQRWSVVGVDRDDVLNVRRAPGTDREIVATLAPTAQATTTGALRALPASIWAEVEVDGGRTGWVSFAFLALPGVVDDVTAQVVDELGGVPAAETLVDLGRIVAETRASTDAESRIVVSVAPTVEDLGEITMDVLGLADDAVVGERLRIFATPDASGEGFGLRTVEATTLCGRGVTDDLRCT